MMKMGGIRQYCYYGWERKVDELWCHRAHPLVWLQRPRCITDCRSLLGSTHGRLILLWLLHQPQFSFSLVWSLLL